MKIIKSKSGKDEPIFTGKEKYYWKSYTLPSRYLIVTESDQLIGDGHQILFIPVNTIKSLYMIKYLCGTLIVSLSLMCVGNLSIVVTL